jgi:NFU1 iron-sulfur cluster scaffold homolog, mitochondrial
MCKFRSGSQPGISMDNITPQLSAEFALHVERTGDPEVLRWVCHHPDILRSTPGLRFPKPGDASPLAVLLLASRVVEVFVSGGELIVRKASTESWSTLAPIVREALLREFDAVPEWLTSVTESPEGASFSTSSTPEIADVQGVVDLAAGPVARSHGGRIEVVAVGHTSITVRMHGACSGCSGTDDTLTGLVLSAVRNRWPHVDAVQVDDSQSAGEPSGLWSRITFTNR